MGEFKDCLDNKILNCKMIKIIYNLINITMIMMYNVLAEVQKLLTVKKLSKKN